MVGTVQAVNAANRAQRGASKPELLSARLLGTAFFFSSPGFYVLLATAALPPPTR